MKTQSKHKNVYAIYKLSNVLGLRYIEYCLESKMLRIKWMSPSTSSEKSEKVWQENEKC